MSDTHETLAAILAEMRKSAKDSYAEKTAKRPEDHEATGTRDALDIKDAIQCLRDDDKYLLDLADRIEAAAERERDEDRQLAAIAESDEAFARCARCDRPERAPGNAAAMREALEKCAELGDQIDNWLGSDEATVWNCRNERSAAHNIMLTARAALAAPARNCDVGTAQEQIDRFHNYCQSHRYYVDEFNGDDCRPDCPIGKIVDRCDKFCDNCWAAWAQMPFDPAEGGEE